jgi:putative flippase GtrA
VLSFSAAIVNNFLWNRYWTYPDSRSKTPRRQLVQFVIISIIGLAIRTPLFAFLSNRLSTLIGLTQLPVDVEFIGHNLALAIAVVVVMFWNFFANRYWTYNDVD